MSRKVYLFVVFVIVCLVVYFYVWYLGKPKATLRFPWDLEGVDVHEFYVRVSDREYLVTKPPSWIELFNLARKGQAGYNYIAFFGAGDIQSTLWAYVYANMSCKKTQEILGSGDPVTDFFLKNDCYWLKKLSMSRERDWYTAFGLIPYFEKLYARKINGDKYIWILAYNTSRGLVVKLYNIFNTTELEELKQDLKNIMEEKKDLLILCGRELNTW